MGSGKSTVTNEEVEELEVHLFFIMVRKSWTPLYVYRLYRYHIFGIYGADG